MRIRTHHTTFLLATAATAIAIAAAPGASAAPSEQPCSDAGGSTTCQRPGNVQVYAAPRALPRVSPPASTRGGVIWGTARGSRRTGLSRSTRPLGITRFTAGFSPDPPSCGLLNPRSLRTFGAPRRRRQHVHPSIPNPLTRVARPFTRRPATRRSPLSRGQRRRTPTSRPSSFRYPIFREYDASATVAGQIDEVISASPPVSRSRLQAHSHLQQNDFPLSTPRVVHHRRKIRSRRRRP